MTKEEAIKRLKEAKGTIQPFLYVDEAIDYAIKALESKADTWSIKEVADALEKHGLIREQESCEDCVSRQAVIDKLNRLIEVERLQGTDEMGYGRERVSAYESMIFEINSEYLYPSITSKEKTGKWIPDDTICEDTLYRCSNCGNVYYLNYGDVKDMGYNYCPNCGAKMESEDEK